MPSFVTPARLLWIVRLAWVAAGLLGGAAIVTVAERPWIALVPWWTGFAVVLLGLVVPGAAGLTVTRLLAPLTVPVTAVVTLAGATTATGLAALAIAVVVTGLVVTGEVGETFVQAAAYGDEQRFLLRAPAALATAITVGWSLWAAATVGGVALASAGTWPLAAVCLTAGAALTWPCVRTLHRLSRRWLVIVPAGVVVHDHVVLGETLMVLRADVRHIGLAPADTGAADLTGPASGYAVEITVGEPVLIRFAGTRADPRGRAIHATAFLAAPVRPGRTITALAGRRLPVS